MRLSEQQDWASVLYYGLNGTGKTTNAAYAAHLGEVTYLAADHTGIKRKALADLGVPVERIDLQTEFDPLKLDKLIWQAHEQLGQDEGPAAVVMDTVTEQITRRMEQIVDAAWDDIVRKAEKRGEDPEESARFFVDRDYYGILTQELVRVIRHMNDLPGCHKVFTAQIRRDVDERTGGVMYGPDCSPSLGGSLMSYVDIIMRLETDGTWKDGTPCLVGYPWGDKTHRGKDQFHVLPRRLAMPTMDRVVEYVRGKLTKDTDDIQHEYRELVKSRRRKGSDED